MDSNVVLHPVISKAKELAEAIMDEEAFKSNDVDGLRELLDECNRIISEYTKIDYAAACQASGCCG